MYECFKGGEDANISSPIHRSEEKFAVEDTKTSQPEVTNNSGDEKPRRGLRRLADLAQNINQWEDNITTVNCSNKHFGSVFVYIKTGTSFDAFCVILQQKK